MQFQVPCWCVESSPGEWSVEKTDGQKRTQKKHTKSKGLILESNLGWFFRRVKNYFRFIVSWWDLQPHLTRFFCITKVLCTVEICIAILLFRVINFDVTLVITSPVTHVKTNGIRVILCGFEFATEFPSLRLSFLYFLFCFQCHLHCMTPITCALGIYVNNFCFSHILKISSVEECQFF